jgi:hypothetical protein
MASEILGLFGTQNPQQLQQDYLSNLMVSPAQIGQQGLLQQLVSTGANAGTMMGYGAGRLLGGKVAGEVEASQVEDVLQQVNKMNLPSNYEKMQAMSSLLAEKGLTKQAMIAGAEAEKLKPVDSTLELIKSGKYTPESVKAAVKAKDFGLLKPVESTAKPPSVGPNAEFISQSKFNKTFSELTPEQKQVVYAESKTETSLGKGLTVLGESLVKSLGNQSGKDVAEAVSPKVIQGKENTISALTRAKEILKEGIYTGGMANAKMAVSKYTPFGSQGKLENTEKYLAYVSTTVIPLLKEFGGNDSNEELKFLQRLVGGEITLEEETLKEIIDSAIIKTQRGIERTQDSVKNVTKGELPSTEVKNQPYGVKPTQIGVGESTTVNGVSIKRVK